jgi:putative effector of murein hydrolase LrgA (UPF0299 family)
MKPPPPTPHVATSNPKPKWVLYTALTLQILVGGLFLLLFLLVAALSPVCDNGCLNETASTTLSLFFIPAAIALAGASLSALTVILWRKLSGGSAIITAVAMTIAYPLALLTVWQVLGTTFNLFDGS